MVSASVAGKGHRSQASVNLPVALEYEGWDAALASSMTPDAAG